MESLVESQLMKVRNFDVGTLLGQFFSQGQLGSDSLPQVFLAALIAFEY